MSKPVARPPKRTSAKVTLTRPSGDTALSMPAWKRRLLVRFGPLERDIRFMPGMRPLSPDEVGGIQLTAQDYIALSSKEPASQAVLEQLDDLASAVLVAAEESRRSTDAMVAEVDSLMQLLGLTPSTAEDLAVENEIQEAHPRVN